MTSNIEDKNKEYLFNRISEYKDFFLENNYNIKNIKSIEVKKILKKFKKSFFLLNSNLSKALENERLNEIFSDGVELIRFATAIKIIYFSSKTIGNNNNDILELASLIEIFGRTQLEKKLENTKKQDNSSDNNIFENINEINIKKENVIYHPEKNIYNSILGFLKNLKNDYNIDKIYLSLYGLTPYESGEKLSDEINNILKGIIKLSETKDLTIILDPVPKFNNIFFYRSLELLKEHGLKIIISKTKIHGKFILGTSSKTNKSKYFLSSGNFIRDKIEKGEYSKEDISLIGEDKSNKGIGTELKELVGFLTKIKNNYSFNFENLIISPFGAKEKLIELISNENTSICITTNVFYDKDIYEALLKKAESGIPIKVIIRDGLKIFIDENILKFPNFKIYKRKNKGTENQQHSRIFSFESQKIAYSGSLGCDPFRFEQSIEILFKIKFDKKIENLQKAQKKDSKLKIKKRKKLKKD